MVVEEAIAPDISSKQRSRLGAWSSFYSKLMEKDKESLDLVIDAIDVLKRRTCGEENDEKLWQSIDRDRDKYVNRFEIQSHLMGYLWRKRCDLEIDDGDKFLWNAMNDISRCLKRIRHDEAPFLLPYQDQKLTLGFLDRLENPPPKDPFGYL